MEGIRQSKRVADDRGQMGRSTPRLINLSASRVVELLTTWQACSGKAYRFDRFYLCPVYRDAIHC